MVTVRKFPCHHVDDAHTSLTPQDAMIVPKLRIRITNIDATVVKNTDKSLDDTTLPRVPVIRVFGHIDGSDGSSKYNACVHIHQVYPYLYIEYTGPKEPEAGASHVTKWTRMTQKRPIVFKYTHTSEISEMLLMKLSETPGSVLSNHAPNGGTSAISFL
jgi:hypothetical protein